MKSRRYSPANMRIREIVKARAGGRCEVGLRAVCLGGVDSLHHREAYGMGGRPGAADSPEELLAVCGDGTRGCHGWIEANPKTAALDGVGWKVPRRGQSRTTAVSYRGRLAYLTPAGTVLHTLIARKRRTVPRL